MRFCSGDGRGRLTHQSTAAGGRGIDLPLPAAAAELRFQGKMVSPSCSPGPGSGDFVCFSTVVGGGRR